MLAVEVMACPLGSRWRLNQKGQPARCVAPVESRADGRCHNLAHTERLCKIHLRKAGRGEFSISAWGIYTKQKLLITCDSRASAVALLDPDETLVRVVARCVPAKTKRRK